MSNMKFFYIRKPTTDGRRGAPIACVAYDRAPDPDSEGEDIVRFALSVANPWLDEFNRATARKIASQRLNGRTVGICVPSDANTTLVLQTVMKFVAIRGYAPSHVTKAARHWLNAKKDPVIDVDRLESELRQARILLNCAKDYLDGTVIREDINRFLNP